jgi:tetratricopeptide (TPR) repeat protein
MWAQAMHVAFRAARVLAETMPKAGRAAAKPRDSNVDSQGASLKSMQVYGLRWPSPMVGGACMVVVIALWMVLPTEELMKMSASTSDKMHKEHGWENFVRWMRAEGAHISKDLHIGNVHHGGFEVRGLVADRLVKEGAVLARIPRKLWITELSLLQQARQLPRQDVFHATPACEKVDFKEFTFATGIAIEIQKGKRSVWAPWLRLLPSADDLRQHSPMFTAQRLRMDFGELPIVNALLNSSRTDLAKMRSCFETLKSTLDATLGSIAPEQVEIASILWKTRSLPRGIVPFFDMFNTAEEPAVNVHVSKEDGSDFMEVRALSTIPKGGEVLASYCDECDNEVLLSSWGVYSEKNTNKLNQLQMTNCHALIKDAPGLSDSLRDVTLAALDVDSLMRIQDLSLSPRCNPLAMLGTEQPTLRCNFARLAWEACSYHWGFTPDPGEVSPSIYSRQQHSYIHTDIGLANLASGKLLRAQSSFRTAISILPTNVQGHKNLASALLRAHQSEAAMKPLKQAFSLQPDDVKVRALLRKLRQDRSRKASGK